MSETPRPRWKLSDPETRDTANQIILRLAERWPKCFAVAPCRRVLLKIGIDADILAAGGFTDDEVNLGLVAYTARDAYLRQFQPGAVRIDLDGNAAGAVAERDVQHAARTLARRHRRAPEKAAQHAAAAKAASATPAITGRSAGRSAGT